MATSIIYTTTTGLELIISVYASINGYRASIRSAEGEYRRDIRGEFGSVNTAIGAAKYLAEKWLG